MKTSIHNDQRGMGHALVVLLVIVVVAVVGFAGWRVMKHDDSKKTASSSAPQSNCMQVYNDAKLCQFAAANADISSTPYTAVDSSVDSQGQTTQITIKSDGKGDFSTSSQNGNQSYNTITMGNTVYVQSGGSWIKYASNAPGVSGSSIASSLKAAFSTTSTPASKRVQYKSLGTEKCGSSTCYKYQVISPTAAGTTYIWINSSTNRLVRLTTKSSQGTNDFTVSYGPVTISTPSPLAPASSTLDSAQQAEEQAIQQAQQSVPQN